MERVFFGPGLGVLHVGSPSLTLKNRAIANANAPDICGLPVMTF